jgi:hypothetical protein
MVIDRRASTPRDLSLVCWFRTPIRDESWLASDRIRGFGWTSRVIIGAASAEPTALASKENDGTRKTNRDE